MTSVRRQPGSLVRSHPLKRKRGGSRLRQLILVVLLLLFASELVLVALTSAWFHISTVRVERRHIVPLAAIAGSLRVPPKSNIFLFNTGRIARKLEPNPMIKKVVVRRQLPDTIVVELFERRAELTLKTQGRLYEVDPYGIAFRVVGHAMPGVPVVSCSVPGPITLGKQVKATIFLTARRSLQLAEQEKGFRVAKITIDQNNDLCLNVRDGVGIRLGQPERLDEKLEVARRLVEQVAEVRNGAEYVDVTCLEAPAFKLKKKT